VDYVNEHLSMKYLHRSHVDTFHNRIYFEDEVLRFIEKHMLTHDLAKFRIIN